MPFGIKLETEENILKSMETAKNQTKKNKNSVKHKEKLGREKNNNNNNNELQQQLRSKEEPIKKIKIISKIEDDLYERLLNKQKIKREISKKELKVLNKFMQIKLKN